MQYSFVCENKISFFQIGAGLFNNQGVENFGFFGTKTFGGNNVQFRSRLKTKEFKVVIEMVHFLKDSQKHLKLFMLL